MLLLEKCQVCTTDIVIHMTEGLRYIPMGMVDMARGHRMSMDIRMNILNMLVSCCKGDWASTSDFQLAISSQG
jgi:hypothetical protein